jgi:hypothetical protein
MFGEIKILALGDTHGGALIKKQSQLDYFLDFVQSSDIGLSYDLIYNLIQYLMTEQNILCQMIQENSQVDSVFLLGPLHVYLLTPGFLSLQTLFQTSLEKTGIVL